MQLYPLLLCVLPVLFRRYTTLVLLSQEPKHTLTACFPSCCDGGVNYFNSTPFSKTLAFFQAVYYLPFVLCLAHTHTLKHYWVALTQRPYNSPSLLVCLAHNKKYLPFSVLQTLSLISSLFGSPLQGTSLLSSLRQPLFHLKATPFYPFLSSLFPSRRKGISLAL